MLVCVSRILYDVAFVYVFEPVMIFVFLLVIFHVLSVYGSVHCLIANFYVYFSCLVIELVCLFSDSCVSFEYVIHLSIYPIWVCGPFGLIPIRLPKTLMIIEKSAGALRSYAMRRALRRSRVAA